jgi:hypothetical protein
MMLTERNNLNIVTTLITKTTLILIISNLRTKMNIKIEIENLIMIAK